MNNSRLEALRQAVTSGLQNTARFLLGPDSLPTGRGNCGECPAHRVGGGEPDTDATLFVTCLSPDISAGRSLRYRHGDAVCTGYVQLPLPKQFD